MNVDIKIDYEKYHMVANGHDRVVDFFSHKQSQATEIRDISVYADIIDDFTEYSDTIHQSIDNECAIEPSDWRKTLGQLENAYTMMIEVNANSLNLYSVNRAIKAVKSLIETD